MAYPPNCKSPDEIIPAQKKISYVVTCYEFVDFPKYIVGKALQPTSALIPIDVLLQRTISVESYTVKQSRLGNPHE